MIVLGVFGTSLRTYGQLQGQPTWLLRLLSIGAIFLLLYGLHLFAFALKREILEEVRKKPDDAA